MCLRSLRGASSTEYGLIAASVSILLMAAVSTVGVRLKDTLCVVVEDGLGGLCSNFSLGSLADLVAIADTNHDGVVADLEFMAYLNTPGNTDMLFAVTCYSAAGCNPGYPVTQGGFDIWRDACNDGATWDKWAWGPGYEYQEQLYTDGGKVMICP